MTGTKISVRFTQISASRHFAPRLVLAMRSGLPYVIEWFGNRLVGSLFSCMSMIIGRRFHNRVTKFNID